MNRSAQIASFCVVAAGLVCAGFYLTGAVAGRVDPRVFGLTALAAQAPIALVAWGVPSAICWFAIGYATRGRHVRLALVGASIEALVLTADCLLSPGGGTWAAELRATAVALLWPVAALTLGAVCGAALGARLRHIVDLRLGLGAAAP